MPAIASIEDLKKADVELKVFKKRYPDAFTEIVSVIKVNKMIGYKNIAQLMFGKSPADLKKSK
jgi:hypothetical protein